MNESNQNVTSNFKSKDEAFEFLVRQSQNKALKDLWKKELDHLPDAPSAENRVARRIFMQKAIAIAATFILLLGSFFWFTNQIDSLHQMACVMIEDSNFTVDSDSFTRGIYDSEIDDLAITLQKEINKALENKDYDAAVGLFLTKEKKSQLTLDDKFYYSLSLARVNDGDYHKAIRLLDDVTIKKEKYYNEALWLQGLLYLKINDPNKSKIILNKLINKSNYQITNIKALLERMAN